MPRYLSIITAELALYNTHERRLRRMVFELPRPFSWQSIQRVLRNSIGIGISWKLASEPGHAVEDTTDAARRLTMALHGGFSVGQEARGHSKAFGFVPVSI